MKDLTKRGMGPSL